MPANSAGGPRKRKRPASEATWKHKRDLKHDLKLDLKHDLRCHLKVEPKAKKQASLTLSI